MKFLQLYSKLFCEPCAVLPSTHAAARALLLQKMTGNIPADFPTQPVASGDFFSRQALATGKFHSTPDDFFSTQALASGKSQGNASADFARFGFYRAGTIALIPVSGVIGSHLSQMDIDCGGCSLERVRAAIDFAAADAEIERLLLAFDSPGGGVAGVPELAAHLASLGKHTVAFTDSLMASAAYWLAAGCDEIWVTPSASAGSIGVYIALLDQTVALQMEGLRLDLFKAGAHKAMGLPGNPLSEADCALLQSRVNKLYDWFTGFVGERRDGGVAGETMQGQVFDGDEAVARHLADGTVSDLGALIAEMQKLTANHL